MLDQPLERPPNTTDPTCYTGGSLHPSLTLLLSLAHDAISTQLFPVRALALSAMCSNSRSSSGQCYSVC